SYAYGADVRYALVSALPWAVLAGVGGEVVCRQVERRFPGVAGTGLLVGVLGVAHLCFLPGVRAETHEAWAARADHAVAREMAQRLPPRSLVLTHNPTMFQVWGVDAAQAHLLQTDREYVERVLAPGHRGGVYFHFNFWCNVADRQHRQFCADLLEKNAFEKVEERWERDYRYALYRLKSVDF
ncbi:MAG: hypothetical protein HQL56_17365, partial [Magnetococcales bacterium]|nr:hypothetical protein [Magnetococcales bacterium]